MKRIISKIKRYGYSGIFKRMCYIIINKITGIHIENINCYFLSLNKNFLKKNLTEGFYLELSYSDFENQIQYNPDWFTPVKMQALKKAFEAGNLFFGIYEKGLLINYGAINFHTMYPTKITLKYSDVYLWDAYTHPQYRRQGLHQKLLEYRLYEAQKVGKERALINVASYNKASNTSIIKSGFRLLNNYYDIIYRNGKQKSTFKYY